MSLSEVLNLLGSLGLFLVGMKVMSDSLMTLAGDGMRRIMASLTSNRFSAALTGFSVTCLIQSSSATTLMVVSFVNAGLLQLTEAIGVIMGANIGTTITAWLIAVLGFKISMIDISLPLMILGFAFYIREDKRASTLGGFIIGFALIFIGLEFMKNSVPDLESNQALFEFIQRLSGYGFYSLLIFAFVGTVLTLVLQSSSATMAIVLIAVSQGWLPFEAGCAIVLGENIGTTITANLAALVSGVNARRAALAHLAFNIIGVTWVLLLFSPFVELVANLSESFQGASPMTTPADAPVGLAIFHTVFNIVNTTLLIFFVPQLAKLVTRLVREKEVAVTETVGAIYLNKAALRYPQTAVHAALQETRRLYRGPVSQAILEGINISKSVLELENEPDKRTLVADSRELLTADFDAVVRDRLDPIYRELVSFGSKVHHKFTLAEKEADQLRNIGNAARDSLLILGDVRQLKRELDQHIGDENRKVRDAADSLRVGLLEFLDRLKEIDFTKGREPLDAMLGDFEQSLTTDEDAFNQKLNELIVSEVIPSAAGASLFSSVGLVRAICQKLIRVTRHVSDAAAAYDTVELELVEQVETS